jgi:FkbM family methyltransferase
MAMLRRTYGMNAVDALRAAGCFINAGPKWLIDVGVGLGTEADEVKAAWPACQVIGLEPNPDTWFVRAADYPGILLPLAAWSENGKKVLSTTSESLEWATLFAGNHGWKDELLFDVKTVWLDDLLKHFDVGDAVLWIDAEGAEAHVIAGAMSLLTEGQIVAINLEVRDAPLLPGAATAAELEVVLGLAGYERRLVWNQCGGDDPHRDNIYALKK